MAGRVLTRRWNDPAIAGEDTRILVTRYRPRGVRKQAETWDEWHAELGPSTALHADAYGKKGPPIELAAYVRRYREEMSAPRPAFFLAGLRARVRGGEDVVLLCSSACVDPAACHRTLLRELVLAD